MTCLALQDSTFKQIAGFIYDKSGIHIPETKKYLVENRLSKVVEDFNLKSFDEFLTHIKYSTNGNKLSRLFDAITTNETYFFREPDQLDVFVREVVPKITAQGGGSLRIWSAACSTGEEPYTLSMMLKGSHPLLRSEISGSDLSEGAIESAKRALYNSYSVRNMPPAYLAKYFVKNGENYALRDDIKKTVRFAVANLMNTREVATLRSMDVIFCRNVLIYFDDKAKRSVVSLLYDCLRPGGYLLIGSSESLHNVTRAFRPVMINKTVVYQRV